LSGHAAAIEMTLSLRAESDETKQRDENETDISEGVRDRERANEPELDKRRPNIEKLPAVYTK